MLVRDLMSSPPITMDARGSIAEAHSLMRHYQIRRIPILSRDRLVGIVSWTDLMRALPSPATSLGAWEIPGLLLRASVKEIMTPTPVTIGPDQPVEEAAFLMRSRKIGGLPVVGNDGRLIGIITESDVFDAFLEMTGMRQGGVRLVVELGDDAGAIADVTAVLKAAGAALTSLAVYTEEGRRVALLRVATADPARLAEALPARGVRVRHLATVVAPAPPAPARPQAPVQRMPARDVPVWRSAPEGPRL
ncbi:MAG: CBS domain-containing protein [Armatimonadota bacterium]|nr:CBS domain-containing protein [Armatimonadota bacterium]MDR7486292.1 CBS domain-containing protein [Armatimonadota bacterium]MDR7532267.1 CBS domain-containing protein [Armatimonadota bacterium]MDR7537260.1 CBS domain-containing protein [Armatimonadota bacterium]